MDSFEIKETTCASISSTNVWAKATIFFEMMISANTRGVLLNKGSKSKQKKVG
jgi:hypothetical protein